MKDTEREYLQNELGAQKVKAAYLLVEMELSDSDYEGPRTQEDVAQRVGVSRQALYEWRTKDRNFIKFKNSIADDFLSDNRTLVYKQLKKLISATQPSVKAIDIFAKLEGLYDNKLTISTEERTTGGESNEDLAKSLESLKAMKSQQEGN